MDVFESAFSQLCESMAFDAVRIVAPDTNLTVHEKRSPSLPEHFPDLTPAQTKSYLTLCLSSGKPILNFIHEKDRVSLLAAIPFQTCAKTMLAEFFSDMTDHIFLNGTGLDDEVGLLSEIDNLRLQTVTDELTGLFNRRYIDDHLPIEIVACVEKKKPLSIIFADLDFYKNVNDEYGHAAGDFVLKGFSELLTRNVRKEKDWVARYGGEEFMIFLSDTEYEKAKEIAERVRIAVMNKAFDHNGRTIKVTCSFGVVTIDDFSAIPSVDKILDALDQRLYRAKKLGRNVVV